MEFADCKQCVHNTFHQPKWPAILAQGSGPDPSKIELLRTFATVAHSLFSDLTAMAELFDFEFLADPMGQEVAAAETADLDEMAILADYVIPADKTPADLERDLEAMVSGIASPLWHLPWWRRRHRRRRAAANAPWIRVMTRESR